MVFIHHQAKWDAFKRQHEKALEREWQEHQQKVRDLNKRYSDEIIKSSKLQEEVKGLTAKIMDLQELNKLVCVSQEDDMESQERRIHTCPCQKTASARVASLTREIKALRDQWLKDKRRIGFYKFLREKRSKEKTGYHRGYVFKEERVVTTEGETADGESVVEEAPPKAMNVRALERAARDLVENLVYLTDGGLKNAAKVFERVLRNPTVKTVMQEVQGFALLQSKDQRDLVQLKKMMGGVSIALEKMLKHIAAEQCRIAYNCIALAFAPDLDDTDTNILDFNAVEKWTCFSRKKLVQASGFRRDFLSGSWQTKEGGSGQPSIYEPHKATRKDSAKVAKQEHIKFIKDAWILNSKDSPAMHNFSKNPDCTQNHTLNKVDGCIECPVDCDKEHVRYAEMTTTELHAFIQKWPAAPEEIRKAITRTMVSDYRPHWVKDKKFDDSKCPTHESVIMALEDYNNQSRELHKRCVVFHSFRPCIKKCLCTYGCRYICMR